MKRCRLMRIIDLKSETLQTYELHLETKRNTSYPYLQYKTQILNK